MPVAGFDSVASLVSPKKKAVTPTRPLTPKRDAEHEKKQETDQERLLRSTLDRARKAEAAASKAKHQLEVETQKRLIAEERARVATKRVAEEAAASAAREAAVRRELRAATAHCQEILAAAPGQWTASVPVTLDQPDGTRDAAANDAAVTEDQPDGTRAAAAYDLLAVQLLAAQQLAVKQQAETDQLTQLVSERTQVARDFASQLMALQAQQGEGGEPRRPLEPPSSAKKAEGFVEHAKKWAVDATLPKDLRLQIVTGAVEQIAPLLIERSHMQTQLEELKTQQERSNKTTSNLDKKVIKHNLEKLDAAYSRADEQLTGALKHLDHVTRSSCGAMTAQLVADRDAYRRAIVEFEATEPGALSKLSERSEQLVNVGPLKVGDEVRAVKDGALTRAKVVRDEGGGEWQLSFDKVVRELITDKFEVGFDTSYRDLGVLPRRKIFANGKQSQKLSRVARAMAEQRAAAEKAATGQEVASTTSEYLLLLYADAERTLEHVRELAKTVQAALASEADRDGVRPIVAPLKAVGRAVIKSLEKYKGDFSRLTDLARATFECTTLTQALAVLEALVAAAGWELLLIKNRLDLAFNADDQGGYRDLLLNLRRTEGEQEGHIIEVQISLVSVLKVKTGGGHANYQVARKLKLNEESTFTHEGALSGRLLSELQAGVIRVLKCTGHSELTRHFDALAAAIQSPSCALSVLELSDCDWPEGRTLKDLLGPLSRLGGKLRHMQLERMSIGGEVPADFFQRCQRLELFKIAKCKVTGRIPPTIGCLKELQKLLIQGNDWEGSLPAEIGSCTRLVHLNLGETPRLSGAIPASVGRLTELGVVTVSGRIDNIDALAGCKSLSNLWAAGCKALTQFPNVATCTSLRRLRLHDCSGIRGEAPAWLAELPALKRLSLPDNDGFTISTALKQQLAKPLAAEGGDPREAATGRRPPGGDPRQPGGGDPFRDLTMATAGAYRP